MPTLAPRPRHDILAALFIHHLLPLLCCVCGDLAWRRFARAINFCGWVAYGSSRSVTRRSLLPLKLRLAAASLCGLAISRTSHVKARLAYTAGPDLTRTSPSVQVSERDFQLLYRQSGSIGESGEAGHRTAVPQVKQSLATSGLCRGRKNTVESG
jgi:hypothetical protein